MKQREAIAYAFKQLGKQGKHELTTNEVEEWVNTNVNEKKWEDFEYVMEEMLHGTGNPATEFYERQPVLEKTASGLYKLREGM